MKAWTQKIYLIWEGREGSLEFVCAWSRDAYLREGSYQSVLDDARKEYGGHVRVASVTVDMDQVSALFAGQEPPDVTYKGEG